MIELDIDLYRVFGNPRKKMLTMRKHGEKIAGFKHRLFWIAGAVLFFGGGLLFLIRGGVIAGNWRSKSSSAHAASLGTTQQKLLHDKSNSESAQSIAGEKGSSSGERSSENKEIYSTNNSSDINQGENIDAKAFAEEFNQWLSEVSIRDDILKPQKAIALFQKLSEEYARLDTIQGKVTIRIDGGEAVFSGDYYVQQEQVPPPNPGEDPWQYMIRLNDSENGMNVLANTKIRGGEKIPAWVEKDGQAQEVSPSGAMRALPYLIVSPLSTMRIKSEKEKGFFDGVIQNVHKTRPEEESGLSGGPFWVFDRIDSQYWLSESGELKRLTVTRRFPSGDGGFDVDKTYDEYQEVNGIRYPKKISMHIKAVGAAGREYVKKLTGKDKGEALVEVSLPEVRINNDISGKWFENKVK